MAVQTFTADTLTGRAQLVTWAAMANGDSGAPFERDNYADRSIQFAGTFGAGGTVICEGSNDGVNYFTLNDPSSAAISRTAAGVRQVLEITRWIRPRVTAGDGTTAIVATMLIRGNVGP